MPAEPTPLNVVIFGYGYMGQIRHRVLRERDDIGRILVVDPNVDARRAERDRLELVAHDEVPWGDLQLAFVCTPNHLTADLCIESLERCGNVFCEKPAGRDWADVTRITRAAENRPGHRLVFGFNHRLHPSIQTARAMIGEGGLGDVLYVKGTYGKSGGVRYRESWRNRPELSGGGILLDQGIHMLDIFQFLLGGLRVREAILLDAFWGCSVEDNAFVLLESERGVPAFLHSSATLWKHTFLLEIGCRNGYLVASGFLSKTGSYGREQVVIGKRQFEDEALALGNPREEIIHFDRDESWDREIDDLIQAVKENRPATHGTLEEARRVMALIRDAYALAEQRVGRRV
jgi:predicted dehydrogenase